MSPFPSLRRALPVAALLAMSAACDDPSSPVAPLPAESGAAVEIQALACTADVRAGTVTCGDGAGEPVGGISRIVLNPLGRWVRLTNGASSYADEILTYDATVQNLIPQTLGVDRSGQPDGGGVRVFFAELPTVTEGTGTVTVNGAETGTFTAPGQRFYRYPGTLAPNQTSAPRPWSFTVPGTVVSFQFKVLVAASVQHPRGWLEIAGGSILRVQRGATRALKAVVRDSLGRDVTASAGPVTWSVEDASVATVDGATLTGASVSGMSTVSAATGGLSASARIVVGAPFVQMAAGEYHTCALTEGGLAYCWGKNSDGQLGDRTQMRRLVPVDVHQEATRFVRITAGWNHTCALTAAGQAWCWGANEFGTLGDNTRQRRLTPVAVQQGSLAFVEISAGESHTCARTAQGQVHCWGSNRWGQLGDNTSGTDRLTPVPVYQRGTPYLDVSLGQRHTCARASARLTYCWGSNLGGQLGDNTITQRNAPVNVHQGDARFAGIEVGLSYSCARTPAGQAYCWGWNARGQLGDGTGTHRRAPAPVAQGAAAYAEINAGGDFTCARTSAGQAWCWGANGDGQLGDNSRTSRNTPVAVQQGSIAFVELSTGGFQTCGRTAAGRVYCWGSNTWGGLGNGTQVRQPVPVAVHPAP
ncbi:hypothetical protein [Longimicrobium sp.]|uniref:RCC1 domain-containing protein n=1 Tax=Longimicrobium sp. TaxID=2029185 RepID=UPI003B3B220F